MDEFEGQAALLIRLRTAEGHLHAVTGMVENGASCEQVLHQLNAVCAALRAAEQTLVRCQLQTSARIIMEEPQAQTRLAEVRRITRLYGLWAGHPLPKEPNCDDTTPHR
jgi:DNA-binding FrmR family transcriptional regulator